jgi:hypothetical protein
MSVRKFQDSTSLFRLSASIVIAALEYFAIAFFAGVGLGTARTVVFAPMIGKLLATTIELPVMLAICWWACGYVLAKNYVSPSLVPRVLMGALALVLLLVAETCFGLIFLGQSLQAQFALYQTAPALLGLCGQLAFAVIPAIRN